MMWRMTENLGGESQWAVPGSAVPEAFTEPTAVAPPGAMEPGQVPSPALGGPVRPERTPGSVPHIALRPMTVADILDGAFAIIKARPMRLLGIAAVFVVPVHLLAAYLQRDLVGGAGLADFWLDSDDPAVVAEAQQGSGGSEFLATILIWLVPGIALMFVAAAVSKLVGAWTAGEDPPAGQLLRSVGRLWWPLLAGFVCVHVVEVLGILTCYIGTVAAMAFYSVTAPVIGAENLGPIEAMKRSARLVGAQFWRVLGICILIAIVDTLLTSALGGLPELLAAWFSWDLEVAWILLAVGNIIGAVISTPFVAAASVLLYLDLRIRTEGLDIEITARQLVDQAG
jgi:hypothetical protein